MAKTFKEIEQADLSTSFNPNEAGEAAVLTPVDGPDADIVVKSSDTNWLDENALGSCPASTKIFRIPRNMYQKPSPQDKFLITSSNEEWEVSRILKLNDRIVTVEAIKDVRIRSR